MLRTPALATMLAAAIGCDAEQVAAPTPETPVELSVTRSRERRVEPVEVSLINPCYNEPVGEEVLLTGNVVFVDWTLSTPTGKTLTRSEVRYRGVTGVGVTSGLKYRVILNNKFMIHRDADNSGSITATNSTVVTVHGPESNFYGKAVLRVLILPPDGELEIQISKFTTECR